MTAVVFYFQVHQPYRIRGGVTHSGPGTWFDDAENERIVKRVAERCYLPMNGLLLRAIERTEGDFRCAFSLSGTVLRQLEAWAPDALDSFVQLAETGHVEFLCETSHHSLASQEDPREFELQVTEHRERIEELFGLTPSTFRNTELILDEEVARQVEALGFDVLLGEGADELLLGRSPRRPYRPRGCERLTLLLRDYVFSDDIAFRFSNREWSGFPLMADTFADWIHRAPRDDAFIGLFMDYETFGEHQGPDTGLFDFMEHLPEFVLADERFSFRTPAELARAVPAREELAIPRPFSWADAERDLSAWLGNPMQRTAQEALYDLGDAVRAAGDADLLESWRRLTTSDHVYYMCTKLRSDGDVHEYFSPHESPWASFVAFMDVVDSLTEHLASPPIPSAR